MTHLPVMIRRMQRLPAQHRIAYLKSLLAVEKPHSRRRPAIEELLQFEVLKQLKIECRKSA